MNQLKVIQKFFKQGRRAHRPWSQLTAEAAEMYGNGYQLSPGQAQLIMQGKWDPTNPELRTAYGLGPRRCAHCHQRIRVRNKRSGASSRAEMPDHMIWWRGLKPDQRDRIIQEVYKVELARSRKDR